LCACGAGPIVFGTTAHSTLENKPLVVTDLTQTLISIPPLCSNAGCAGNKNGLIGSALCVFLLSFDANNDVLNPGIASKAVDNIKLRRSIWKILMLFKHTQK